MRMSQSFVKTLRSAPKDETATNGVYLTRAGYIHKEMAGVYDYLPLGIRVIENIKSIVRSELNPLGCEEILMSTLQSPTPWEKTKRFSDQEVDIWFKTNLSSGGELGLAPTHEEPITMMVKDYIKSYKDLPLYVYQFQTKFRNEKRAKSGILRGREFLMKDLYSFHTSKEDLDQFYEQVMDAYQRIFDRIGIGEVTFPCFASGGIFSKFSHEFQTFLPVGEDTVYYNNDKSVVLNKEVFLPEVLSDLKVKESDLTTTTAAEVGNIFKLQLKYSAPLELTHTDPSNKVAPVYMGCYGIGISRLMGVVAELFSDEKGLVWPEPIAPYRYYLIGIGNKGQKAADEFYKAHQEDTIYDDRDFRPGEKFADSELLGIPYRIVISDKTLGNQSAEITDRRTGKTELIPLDELGNNIKST